MASRSPLVTTTHLGIVELYDICHVFRRRSEQLFETLGGWVVTTDDTGLQQLIAEACHQHAWHACLWAARTPTIPVDEVTMATPSSLDGADRSGSYRAALSELSAELDTLATRVDRRLDPSTSRVIDLVAADLDALAARAKAFD
jgi:hypothetical protein